MDPLAHRRRGNGHRAGCAGAHLRAILHDQGRWRRNRARSVGVPRHRAGARRANHRREPGRPRQLVHRLASGGRMTRVLFVDDEASMCDLATRALGKSGIECVAKTSADEALALVNAEPFDCVVTDVRMRAMNGLELCQRVVATKEDLPVIVITAFGSMELAIGAIRAGAYDFMVKPLEMDALAMAIERAAQHRR